MPTTLATHCLILALVLTSSRSNAQEPARPGEPPAAPGAPAASDAPAGPDAPARPDAPAAPDRVTRVEVISTAVPWPRGVRYIDGKLYALARGVHRSAGGPQDTIEDMAGTIFRIDPGVCEPATREIPPGAAVRTNGEVVAAPTSPPFQVWDRHMPATRDTRTDRPYCMLIHDPLSQNFFVCGYSGIDLPTRPGFRKNATDSVHRFDLRTGKWHIVEAHDPGVVPEGELAKEVSSRYYPHHDVHANEPPHGLVNGPCGAVIAGRYLYVGAKDNTALARYDLEEIRKSPEASPPASQLVFAAGASGNATIEVEGHGAMAVNGTCALAVHDDFLYVAFRTTSQVLRFPLHDDGAVKVPLRAQYIAHFAEYDPELGRRSADIYDMVFDGEGRCYVSPGYDGAIYRYTPDPDNPYDARKRDYEPYVDLDKLLGVPKTGNICLDDQGNLYVCSSHDLTPDSSTRGVIYRVRAR